MMDCSQIAKVTIEGGTRWSARQRVVLPVVAGVALAVLLWWNWSLTGALLMTLGVGAYFVSVAFRAIVFAASGDDGGTVRRAEERLADAECPPAVVLVPAYHEAEVLPNLMRNLAQMDYPDFRVLVVLEERDTNTIAQAEMARAALASAGAGGATFQTVVVPAAIPGPAGKPRALNYALEQNAHLLDESEFVVIFDAEDLPDPLQLRMAAQAFRQEGNRLGAVQAELRPLNARRNWFTWMWAGLYASTFRVNMAGLARISSIVPLGGTSNYVRTEALRRIGGWDMFNVTEDLDLGVKLRRAGYRVLMLPSVTWEEATVTFTDQVKQASRWMKGHAATAIAHLRHPVGLARDLGFRGSLGFFAFVVLPVPTTLLGPVFWALTSWYIAQQPSVIRAITPQGTLYLGLLCLVANFLFVWQVMVAMRRSGQYLLVPLMPLVLLYVQTVSVCATAKAVWEICRGRLYYWDKTKHYGMSALVPRPAPAAGAVSVRAAASSALGRARRIRLPAVAVTAVGVIVVGFLLASNLGSTMPELRHEAPIQPQPQVGTAVPLPVDTSSSQPMPVGDTPPLQPVSVPPQEEVPQDPAVGTGPPPLRARLVDSHGRVIILPPVGAPSGP